MKWLYKVVLNYWGGQYHSKGADLVYYVFAPSPVTANQKVLLAFMAVIENREFSVRVITIDEICSESSIIQ